MSAGVRAVSGHESTPSLDVQLDYDKAVLWLRTSSRIERQLRARPVEKEPELIAFLESLDPGTVFWDVGSNTGAYSLIAASRGLTVIAIEPAIPNVARLDENCALNNLDVVIIPVALGAHPSVGFLTPGGPGETHELASHGWGVPVLTVDMLVDMGYPHPAAMKIDVDGGELALLQGAKKTLRRVDAILVEVSDVSRERVSVLLGEAGLREVDAVRHARSGVTNLVFRR